MPYLSDAMRTENLSLSNVHSPAMTEWEFRLLRDLIYSQTYIFYTDRQKALFERKIRPRALNLSCASFQEYYDILTDPYEGKQEFIHLIESLAVHETSFFRISGHFRGLQEQIFPGLLQQRGPAPIQLWSAGCSTGEEPYSIVMSFLETLARRQAASLSEPRVLRVLATDISPMAIQKAREGKYSRKHVKKVQQALLDKYFMYHDDYYEIRDLLKQFVNFTITNLVEIETLPNDHFDIIFCRNVLIYFDRYAQVKLLHRFIQMLPCGGYLFLGDAESIHSFPEIAQHFEFVESGNALIYQKRGVLLQ